MGGLLASSATQHGKYQHVDGFKCNVDVAFQPAKKSTFFRCCIHDSDGRFMMAQMQQEHGHMSVFEGEASTPLETIRFTRTKWRERVIFERDSQMLVASLKDKYHGTSEFSVIVSNIIF
jgi:hypothetical protein